MAEIENYSTRRILDFSSVSQLNNVSIESSAIALKWNFLRENDETECLKSQSNLANDKLWRIE